MSTQSAFERKDVMTTSEVQEEANRQVANGFYGWAFFCRANIKNTADIDDFLVAAEQPAKELGTIA